MTIKFTTSNKGYQLLTLQDFDRSTWFTSGDSSNTTSETNGVLTFHYQWALNMGHNGPRTEIRTCTMPYSILASKAGGCDVIIFDIYAYAFGQGGYYNKSGGTTMEIGLSDGTTTHNLLSISGSGSSPNYGSNNGWKKAHIILIMDIKNRKIYTRYTDFTQELITGNGSVGYTVITNDTSYNNLNLPTTNLFIRGTQSTSDGYSHAYVGSGDIQIFVSTLANSRLYG